ncbi:pif1 helicase-like protein, putative [Leishmania tarentolae]|uniref:ATP-dependent DNA helicase n=1 Tax=Leishmania tarentolae TaxID=5689 RepID=A0A640KB56_LEITA|nr:pif1 helicase-like protein, putative [Leishmania tarentolae]
MFRHFTSSSAVRQTAVQLSVCTNLRTSVLFLPSAAGYTRASSMARGSSAAVPCGALVSSHLTSMRWQSSLSSTPPKSKGGKRRGRPPGRRAQHSPSAPAAVDASKSMSVSDVSRTEADTASDHAMAAVAQQMFVGSTEPMPVAPARFPETSALNTDDTTPLTAQTTKLVEPPMAAVVDGSTEALRVTATPASSSVPTIGNVSWEEERPQTNVAAASAVDAIVSASPEVMAKPKKSSGRRRKQQETATPTPAAIRAAEASAAPASPAVDSFHESLEEESFFSSLLQSDKDGSSIAEPRESTLVYNALTGRMTSETSVTMQCLRELGFGINDQRQVIMKHPEVLNALAERVRAGTAALPTKWPVTVARIITTVIMNKNISDPAKALEQMIQVKTNSVMRSRYTSVVSAANSDLDATMAETSAEQTGMNGGHDLDQGIELNDEQKRVIDIALRGHHLYIGGSAGTGKTVLLRAVARRLQGHRLRVAMTATTGVAGCHIGGSTFHHALGVTSRGEFMRRSSILDYDVIIIDEVSMFPQSLFEEFDRVLREEAGTPDLPFGGVQIILCGDFLQLGCINEKSLIGSPLFHKNFVKVRLETQVRQTANSKFANDLQLMRLGMVPSDLQTTVQLLPPGTMVDSAVNLLPTNKEVHVANERQLQELPGDPLTLTPETGITSLQCETTATLLLRTTPDFNESEFARHTRSLLQATLDLPRASLLSLYRVYEDGHVMRVMLPPGESVAWRDAMRERFLEIAGLLNDLELGATVTEIIPSGDGLHTPETEEYLHKVMSKHPIAQPLTLKKGCRVLLRSNLSSNLVNGSIGTVVDFVECKEESFPEYIKTDVVKRCIDRYRVFCFTECGMPVPMVPVVQFYSGEEIAVPPWEFSVGGGPNTHFYSLSSVALPLSLAYAFTVHKVQGLTLVGRVHLELSRMWPCEHLLYVAMSRVRNPEQLSMSSFTASMVVANDACVHFDKALRGALQLTVADLAKYPISAWKRCNDTIYHLRCRGASLRRLLEGVTSMSGSGSPLMVSGRDSEQAHNSRLDRSGGSFAFHSRSDAEDDQGVLSTRETTSTSDGSRVMVRVGRHGSGSTGVADEVSTEDLAFNIEHLSAIQQSVLVARRMRKLVRHVERVAKLTDARRRTKSNGKSSKGSAAPEGSAHAASAAAEVVHGSPDASSRRNCAEVEDVDAEEPLDVERAASVMAASVAAAAAASPAVSLAVGEEHTF